MAAMLIEIKSRMLLPRPGATDEEPEDPRAELVRRLLEYERMKKAAQGMARRRWPGAISPWCGCSSSASLAAPSGRT